MRLFQQSSNTKGMPRIWGYAIQVAGQISAPVTLINLVLLGLTFSRVWGVPWYLVIGFIAVGISTLGLFAFKVLLPGVYSAQNEQWYKHDNPMRKDLEEIKHMLTKLEERE
jgi:hypothetical protein